MNPATLIENTVLYKDLHHSIEAGSFPHASLFIDPDQYGALPMALSCAQGLLKQTNSDWTLWADLYMMFPFIKHSSGNETHEDHLEEWREFVQTFPYGNQWDWTHFLASGNKQLIIPVHAIGELQRKMTLKSFGGGNKVCILWGADQLNPSAANKLLKLLEEPPENTYFILITEDLSKILPTVLSRCQQTQFNPQSEELLKQQLTQFGVEAQLIPNLTFQAEGSIGKALQLIQNNSGQEEFEGFWVSGLRAAFMARGNKAIVLELLQWAEQLAQLNRETQKAFISYGLRLFRAALMHNYGMGGLANFVSGTGFNIEKLAPFIHGENVLDIVSLLERYSYQLERNANPKMLFTDLAFKLTRLLHLKESVVE